MKKYVNRNEVRTDGKILGKVRYKPYHAFISIIIFAFILLILKTTAVYIISAILILLAIAGILFIRDRVILEVYDDCLLLHDEKNDDRVIQIPIEKITRWEIARNSSFTTSIYTDDPELSVISFDCFATGKVHYLLRRVADDKQSINIGADIRRKKRK